MLRNMSNIILAGCAAFSLSLVSAPVVAQTGQITAQEDGANRVNIAGRQRMLSQRMAKAACFIGMGVQTTKHTNMLRDAKTEFNSALTGLRFGDESRRLAAPTQPEIRQTFARVTEVWVPFSTQIDLLLADASNSEAAEYISENNLKLLSYSNDAVTVMAGLFGGAAISEDLANTINIAGRQRMLSQRVAKSFCEVVRSPGDPTIMDDFVAAIDLFEASHVDLMNGNAANGVIYPPSSDVELQLILVDEAWRAMKSDLELAAAGIPPDQATIDRVADINDTLLVEMNKAVGLYAAVSDNGS